MLNDIPYKNIVNTGRKYDVWVLHDIYNSSFTDIAKKYHVTAPPIVSDYYKALLTKLKYYVNHLSIVYGYENTTHFRKIWSDASTCYCELKYVAAYFEREYTDILNKYRNGEPGYPEQFLRNLPPLRTKFSKRTISNVVRLRETERMTFIAIGKRLRMTREKARDLYSDYYFDLFRQLSAKIKKITGEADLEGKYYLSCQIGNGKKLYDTLINDYPELCKSILEAGHRR